MLLLTRRSSESIIIKPASGIDQDMSVRELFEEGAITITITEIKGSQVRVGVEASRMLTIVREELV